MEINNITNAVYEVSYKNRLENSTPLFFNFNDGTHTTETVIVHIIGVVC